MIVHSSVAVTLVGGGQLGTSDLSLSLTIAPRLVAADGGAAAALAAGLRPEAVFGDMDSLEPALVARLGGAVHRIDEQETTNFDKALRSISAPLVVAVGFTGGRMDHALAVLHTLILRPALPCIVLGDESLTFLCPPLLRLDLAPETLVSLFPMGAVRVASEGLVWPTAGLLLAPDSRIGTSNAATGPVTLRPDAARLLVILPRGQLGPAAAALGTAGRWA